MDDVFSVTVLDRFKQLINVVAHLVELDAIRILLEYFKQIFLHVFEYQIQPIHPSFHNKQRD